MAVNDAAERFIYWGALGVAALGVVTTLIMPYMRDDKCLVKSTCEGIMVLARKAVP